MATTSRQLSDAALAASRAMSAVLIRSMADARAQVTLPQLRALVILDTRGPQSIGAVAEQLGVHQTTMTRVADRLVRDGWIQRGTSPHTRREVLLSLTEQGTTLVADMIAARRRELDRILASVPRDKREVARAGLCAFAEAAGEQLLDDAAVLAL